MLGRESGRIECETNETLAVTWRLTGSDSCQEKDFYICRNLPSAGHFGEVDERKIREMPALVANIGEPKANNKRNFEYDEGTAESRGDSANLDKQMVR